MADPLSILGAVETSLNFTVLIYTQVNNFIHYKSDAHDLAIRFKDDEQLLRVFLAFFTDNKDHLGTSSTEFIVDATRHLNEMLGSTASDLQKYHPGATFRRISWGFVKSSLEEAEHALREWVSRLQSRFSMLPKEIREDLYDRMMKPGYNYEAKPVRALLNHVRMKKAKMQSLGDGEDNASLAEQPQTEPRGAVESEYWKDMITIPDDWQKPENKQLIEELRVDVARLTVVLRGCDVKVTHIPAAACWYEVKDGDETEWFGLAYKIPPKVIKKETRSLKKAIKDSAGLFHPLNERLRIATELVSAVHYLHELEYVHKSIRSDHVKLTFEQQDNHTFQTGYLGHVNLTGFSFARKGTGDARSRNDKSTFDWKTQFYCHPKRQNIEQSKQQQQPASTMDSDAKDEPKLEYFKYKHDIYSVGVVLLEIGLWQDLAEHYMAGLMPADAPNRKETLTNLAVGKLSHFMGKRYAGVVSKCLDVDGQDEQFRMRDVLSELDDIQI